MSLHRLSEIINKAAKTVYDAEKFPVGVLGVRVRQAAQLHPFDQTLVQMSNFLNKRASSSTVLFITRAELKDVYNKLYTTNNKFGELFGEELGIITKLASSKKMVREEEKELNYEQVSDPLLKNALASAFDKNLPLNLYSDKTAVSAEKSCYYQLKKAGLEPKKIEVVAGQSDVLICKATYETPKGESSVLVPVEIKNEMALLPTIFLGTDGFLELEAGKLQDHLVKTAGKSYQVNVQALLGAVSQAKNGIVEPLSEVEQIVLKVSAAKETSDRAINGILYQEVDKVAESIKEPEYYQAPEVQEFAQRLTSNAGVAEFVFGKNIVAMGRNLLLKSLKSFGYNAQVGIAGNDDKTIYYAVAVDSNIGFKVPIKVDKNGIKEPNLIISASGVSEFSKAGISEILANKGSDYEMLSVASPFCGQKPSELLGRIKQAMSENNYLKAEDALNVLKSSGDEKAFKTGYDIYCESLRGEKKEEEVSKCSMQYKSAHSQHLICGHTNLPLHKVYQDTHGDCKPLYRKGMAETAEGGSFLHSKIYFG